MQYGLVALWWAVFLALGVLGAPLAAALLPDAADRGAGVAVPLALVVLLVPTYWVGQVAFGRPTAVVGLVVLLVASGLALAWQRRTGGEDAGGRDADEAEGLPADGEGEHGSDGAGGFPRRAYAETALVFTLAFAFLVAVRAVDAGAHPGGGEKFLDFGLLQSLLRAHRLPPPDVWFAGAHVVYYYGGHLYAATLALLTGTPGREAYNLALAGAYATEVAAVFGLARDVAADRGYPRLAAGALAAALFGLASNLLTPLRLLAGALPRGVVAPIAGAFGVPMAKATVTPATFFYWPASRPMRDAAMTYITEFPFFSYLNGDLHAHMLAPMVSLLALAVCYAYWRTPAGAVRRRAALLFGALPPCVGYVTLTNAWSLPVVAGLAFLAVALAPADPADLAPRRVRDAIARGLSDDGDRRLGAEGARVLVGAAVALVVATLGLLWVAPFVPNVLLASAGGRGLAVLPDRSPLGGFLLVQGGFLVVLWSYLAGKVVRTPRRAAGVVALVVGLAAAGWALDAVVPALVGPLALAGWWLVRVRRERANVGFETLALVAGAGLLLVVEFVYLRDDAAPGRLNTVFKTYFAVWTLWSVAGGIALSGLLARAETWLPVSPDARRVVGVACVFLLVGALVGPYAGFALTNHFEDGHGPTLDATAFVERTHPGEAAAIAWLGNRSGQPTVAERPGRTVYAWRSAPSSLTGLPTVVGWRHEAIYRGALAYRARASAVDRLYGTRDDATRNGLLRAYGVRYVWDGPLERARYGNVTARLRADPALSVAHRSGTVTVFAVRANATSQ